MPLVPRDTALERGMRRFSRRGLIKVSAGGAAGAALAVGPVQRAEQALIQATPATPEPQTHEFTLTASEFDWELMADVPVRVWGYNGQMPGPELRVTRGRYGPGHPGQPATGADHHPLARDQCAQCHGRGGRAEPGRRSSPGATFIYDVHRHPGRHPLVPLPHRSRGAGAARPLRRPDRRTTPARGDLRPRVHPASWPSGTPS